jgi:hypothetical protein
MISKYCLNFIESFLKFNMKFSGKACNLFSNFARVLGDIKATATVGRQGEVSNSIPA